MKRYLGRSSTLPLFVLALVKPNRTFADVGLHVVQPTVEENLSGNQEQCRLLFVALLILHMSYCWMN